MVIGVAKKSNVQSKWLIKFYSNFIAYLNFQLSARIFVALKLYGYYHEKCMRIVNNNVSSHVNNCWLTVIFTGYCLHATKY
jgi:hypothetical protein